jgi:hypothetical protein
MAILTVAAKPVVKTSPLFSSSASIRQNTATTNTPVFPSSTSTAVSTAIVAQPEMREYTPSWLKAKLKEYTQKTGSNAKKDFPDLYKTAFSATSNNAIRYNRQTISNLLNATGNGKPVNTAATTTPEPKKDFFGQIGDFLKGALKIAGPLLTIAGLFIPGLSAVGAAASGLGALMKD